jgi:hypothetical protein
MDLEGKEVIEVVTTNITQGVTSHKICEMAERLAENHVTMFRNTLFQLFLQVPTSMLILAHTSDLPLQIFQASTSKPVD